MITIKEIRQRNLLFLESQAGGRKEFTGSAKAEELKLSYGYLGQLINSSRGIGDKVARKIEELADKQEGWLDVPHPEYWDITIQELVELNSLMTDRDINTSREAFKADLKLSNDDYTRLVTGKASFEEQEKAKTKLLVDDSIARLDMLKQRDGYDARIKRLPANKRDLVDQYLSIIESD